VQRRKTQPQQRNTKVNIKHKDRFFCMTMAPINPSSSSSPPAPKRARTEQSSLTSFFKSSPKSPSQEKPSSSSNNDNNNENNDNKKDDTQAQPKTEHPTTTQDTKNKAILGVEDGNFAAATAEASPLASDVDPIIPQALVPHAIPPNSRWQVYQNACLVRTCRHSTNDEVPRTKVAGLDMDGTLFTWRMAGWPSRMEHYELWNNTVIQKLRQLYDDEHYQLVLFSNQGAIRGAFTGKKATFVKSLIEWLAVAIDRPLSAVLATNKKLGYHKPSANMWTVAEEFCTSGAGASFDVANSFFVGDSVRSADDPQGGVDEAFAENVGKLAAAAAGTNGNDESESSPVPSLKFYTPTELFGPSAQDQRAKLEQEAGYETPEEQVLQTRAALTGGYLEGPILLLLCGAQGSGKSTFCGQLVAKHDNEKDEENHWVHLSQDTINNGKPGNREKVEKAAAEALSAGKSVVIDRMHLDTTQRAHFVNVAEEHELAVPVHAVVFTPPKDVLAERVRHRQNHPVHGEAGAKMAVASAGKLQLPSYIEGIDLWSATSTVEGAARLVQLYRSVLVASSANDSKEETMTTTAIPENWSVANGRTVPAMALGTMGLGRKTATEVVSLASRLGFTAFDTAPTYKNED
jgi:bifunctional polynucleotide phosphatase/kinase